MLFSLPKLTVLITIISLFLVQSCSLQNCDCEEVRVELKTLKSDYRVLKDTIMDQSIDLIKIQGLLDSKLEEISELKKHYQFRDSIKDEQMLNLEKIIKLLKEKD
ncbi:MAG: hypothetical protein GY810_20015 [Aureispira sp.]|nr:hypothetical protein [Aureispira sp.]